MDSGLLSLKWNNHGSTFFHVLSLIRKKECYCDVTLTCEGKFYPVHKLVLSTCSEYFEEIFSRTQCKHPFIVLKDVRSVELEALLNYMYLGEVNVLQAELAGLIKAAECLRVKGLAVPDEAPSNSEGNVCERTSESRTNESRGRDSKRSANRDNSVNQSTKRSRLDEEHTTQVRQLQEESPLRDTRELPRERVRPSSISNDNYPNYTHPSPSQDVRERREHMQEHGKDSQNKDQRISPVQPLEVIVSDSPTVKAELEDPKEEHDLLEEEDMMNSDSSLAYDQNTSGIQPDSGGGCRKTENQYDSQMPPQTMEELVAQAMPGTSSLHGESLVGWGGTGDHGRFGLDGFQMDDSGGSSQSSQQQMHSRALLRATPPGGHLPSDARRASSAVSPLLSLSRWIHSLPM